MPRPPCCWRSCGHGQTAAGCVSLLVLSAVLMVLFVRNERRVKDPVLPIDLLLTPNIFAAVCGSLLIGGLLFGIDTFVPLFVQGVRGGSATAAGRMITSCSSPGRSASRSPRGSSGRWGSVARG
ncbi:MAG: hypothetical protein U0835_12180 [Isosphaeraceae bacterium]